MRAAPPVEVPLAAARAERAACALLHALAAFGPVVAAGSALGLGQLAWLATAAVACAAVLGVIAWRPPRGRLRWDGEAWTVLPAPGQCQRIDRLRVQIDFGTWVLLRWTVEGQRRAAWAPLRAADAGASWHGLRVALAAHGAALSSRPCDPASTPPARCEGARSPRAAKRPLRV